MNGLSNVILCLQSWLLAASSETSTKSSQQTTVDFQLRTYIKAIHRCPEDKAGCP